MAAPLPPFPAAVAPPPRPTALACDWEVLLALEEELGAAIDGDVLGVSTTDTAVDVSRMEGTIDLRLRGDAAASLAKVRHVLAIGGLAARSTIDLGGS